MIDIEFAEKGDLEPMPEKLTEWKREPTITELKSELESTRNSQSVLTNKIDEWNDLKNITGNAIPKTAKGRSSVQPRLIQKQCEWRYAAMTEPFHSSAEKLFNVQPATWEDEEAAQQNTLLLNWQFRTKIDRIRLIDNIVRSNVDDGNCIARVGWVQKTEIQKVEVPIWEMYQVVNPEIAQMIDEATQLEIDNPRGFEETVDPSIKESVKATRENGVHIQCVQVGTKIVEEEVVTDNYPTVDVLDMKNVFIDPTCDTNIDDAQFIINSYEMTKGDLVSQPEVYKNLEYINWDDSSPATEIDHYTTTPTDYITSIPDNKKVVVYDYWGYYDINDDGVLVPIVATWIGSVCVRMSENPYPDGKPPFVLMVYNPVKRKLYGEPDAPLIADNQRVVGAIMRGVIDTMARSANSQTGWAIGALDTVNKRKFARDEDYEFNPDAHPTNAMIQHVFPELPTSVYNLMEMQNNEAESISGTKSFTGGISGNAYGDVAAGIRGTLDATSKREMAILRRIADGVKRIGVKILAMNCAFLSKSEVIRVTNSQYIEISPDDIQGNFDLIVDIATAEVDDTKANDLAFMLQTIGPVVDTNITMLVMSEIAELKRMPGLAHKLANYQPPPPSPEEQEMMQLDLEARRLEVEKLRSEVEYNLARANKANSEADESDLNYINEESGVKHQQEMEKMQAQSEGNMRRDILNNAMKANQESAKNAPDPFKAMNDLPLLRDPNAVLSPQERDQYAKDNPILSLGSQEFDPNLDPSLNLAGNI